MLPAVGAVSLCKGRGPRPAGGNKGMPGPCALPDVTSPKYRNCGDDRAGRLESAAGPRILRLSGPSGVWKWCREPPMESGARRLRIWGARTSGPVDVQDRHQGSEASKYRPTPSSHQDTAPARQSATHRPHLYRSPAGARCRLYGLVATRASPVRCRGRVVRACGRRGSAAGGAQFAGELHALVQLGPLGGAGGDLLGEDPDHARLGE